MTSLTHRAARAVLALATTTTLVAGIPVLAVSSGAAAPLASATDECQSNPATAVRGKTPLCGNAAGRTVTITSGPVAPGGTVTFSGTGFVRDVDGKGQTLNVRFNDVDLIGGSFTADDAGNVTGSVTIPSQAVLDTYRTEYGAERFWLRFLVGSGAPDASDDSPARSLHAYIEITETPGSGGTDDTGGTGGTGGTSTTGTGNGGTTNGTTGGSGTTNGGTTTAGQLPQTGIEDSPAVLWAGALVLGAGGLVLLERTIRSRRPAGSAPR